MSCDWLICQEAWLTGSVYCSRYICVDDTQAMTDFSPTQPAANQVKDSNKWAKAVRRVTYCTDRVISIPSPPLACLLAHAHSLFVLLIQSVDFVVMNNAEAGKWETNTGADLRETEGMNRYKEVLVNLLLEWEFSSWKLQMHTPVPIDHGGKCFGENVAHCRMCVEKH